MKVAPSSPELTKGFLKLWSGLYDAQLYPLRAFSEFKNSKTRIFMETGVDEDGQHTVIVGNALFDLSMVKSGVLDFLTGLSSTNTEVVYLGTTKNNYATETSPRLEFLETNGFQDAARDLRSIVFPGVAERERAKRYYDKTRPWDLLSPDAKNAWLRYAQGDNDLARKGYEISRTRDALLGYKNDLLIRAVKSNVKPEISALPTVLAYPKAWESYINYRLRLNPVPPEWFVKEFLEPLGFDKRVTLGQ
jgi:hypothetical protein